ncbi:citrate lyase beta subunit [Legionella lansingensis]|uniref:Citrate lyase beta subunit n=1 Tax=Legionella lansingensis TaxID=45067 RepID=A0A0W0VGV2_9GAMM|nr:CoA ester lyase [Legionella lansingensis]KTD19352.1 citrate lyase beta subunit [Legionella lansingensis]SNV52979.1 citrate lyase beta subunit [Legionella lansingensis]
MKTIATRLSRSMLFVPASRPEMFKKAFDSCADVICLDLEDSVAIAQKEGSRAHIVQALKSADVNKTLMLRINALDTHFAYRDVIEIVEAAGQHLDLIMLPKVQTARDVHFLDDLLTQIEMHKKMSNRIGIEAQIETASAFMELREIAQSSERLEGLIFGSGDYAASMHMPLSSIGAADHHDAHYPGHRWHAVMHAIVAAARANGLRCMDGPYANFKDAVEFTASCEIALAMGFDGKQCIHPIQLETANRIFSPSSEDVYWAKAVMAAYEQANSAGNGAINLNGKMVDAANIRVAEVIIQRQQLIERELGKQRSKS